MLFKNPQRFTKKAKSPKVSKNANKQIFVDKIVDRRTNPTLYNIESARATIALKLGNADNLQAVRGPARRTNQKLIATDVLAQMNVMMVDVPRTFSLLEADSDKDAVESPYIVDAKDFKNTVNNTVTAEDKFVYAEDPFYQLDDMPNLNQDYVKTKSVTTKQQITFADPSFVLSNMTIVNNSPSYFGKNKYL